MADVTFRLRQNLATLLRDRGITAAQLSRKTGVAKQVLSDWMSGVQPRKLEQLYAVAQALGVTMDVLCFAQSDGEFVDSGNTLRAGSQTASESTLGAGVNGLDEIRGRFEVFMRRI